MHDQAADLFAAPGDPQTGPPAPCAYGSATNQIDADDEYSVNAMANLDLQIIYEDPPGTFTEVAVSQSVVDTVEHLHIPLPEDGDPLDYRVRVVGSGQAVNYGLAWWTAEAPPAVSPLACAADVNGDCTVDVQDLVAILLVWGPCQSCAQDLNLDGNVDVQDLVTVLLNWGPC